MRRCSLISNKNYSRYINVNSGHLFWEKDNHIHTLTSYAFYVRFFILYLHYFSFQNYHYLSAVHENVNCFSLSYIKIRNHELCKLLASSVLTNLVYYDYYHNSCCIYVWCLNLIFILMLTTLEGEGGGMHPCDWLIWCTFAGCVMVKDLD